MTPSSLNLLSLYPGSITSVSLPWRADGISTSTAIATKIMFAVGLHFYNRTFTCRPNKVSNHLCSASKPYKITRILNGNRTFNLLIFIYLYFSSADKFIIELNRMQCLYRTSLPSHQRRCHITCGIQRMPSLSQHYSFDL